MARFSAIVSSELAHLYTVLLFFVLQVSKQGIDSNAMVRNHSVNAASVCLFPLLVSGL